MSAEAVVGDSVGRAERKTEEGVFTSMVSAFVVFVGGRVCGACVDGVPVAWWRGPSFDAVT
jgi:hypothetical protein